MALTAGPHHFDGVLWPRSHRSDPPALPLAPSLIGFASRHPPFTRYAYIDVLQGRIPSGAFRNKHVLIGSNATGVATTAVGVFSSRIACLATAKQYVAAWHPPAAGRFLATAHRASSARPAAPAALASPARAGHALYLARHSGTDQHLADRNRFRAPRPAA